MASSLLAICATVPCLIVSLVGGAVADRHSKKKIMLVCDFVAAVGTVVILCCFFVGNLHLWVLCIVNMVNGFMNAFQGPASQVAVSLLLEKDEYVKIGGIQSAVKSMLTQVLTPVGFLLGAVLADYVFEPFMKKSGTIQAFCSRFVGVEDGSGMGLLFVMAGVIGIVLTLVLGRNKNLRVLEE